MIALEQLNTLPPGDFVAALAGIFEHSPWVADRVHALRPFASRLQLLDAMRAAVHDAPLVEQLSLIRAHPKLGARGRSRSTLTAASAGEQRRAGLDACSDGEFARLQELNRAYEEKFSFPFILAVRGHDPASIIENIEARVNLEPAHERRTALREIGLIAEYRLADAVATTAGPEIAAMRDCLVRCHVAATDVGSERAAHLREWMLAAGGEVSSLSGVLHGVFRSGAAAPGAVGVGLRSEPDGGMVYYEEPMGCLLGVAAIQQFRQRGADLPCELRIAATAAQLAQCADDPREVQSLDRAAQDLEIFMRQGFGRRPHHESATP
jgi:OHCU decarboxylase